MQTANGEASMARGRWVAGGLRPASHHGHGHQSDQKVSCFFCSSANIRTRRNPLLPLPLHKGILQRFQTNDMEDSNRTSHTRFGIRAYKILEEARDTTPKRRGYKFPGASTNRVSRLLVSCASSALHATPDSTETGSPGDIPGSYATSTLRPLCPP